MLKQARKLQFSFFYSKLYFNTRQNQKKIMTLSFMKQLRANSYLCKSEYSFWFLAEKKSQFV